MGGGERRPEFALDVVVYRVAGEDPPAPALAGEAGEGVCDVVVVPEPRHERQVVRAHDPRAVGVRHGPMDHSLVLVLAGDPEVEKAMQVAVATPGGDGAQPGGERRVRRGGGEDLRRAERESEYGDA